MGSFASNKTNLTAHVLITRRDYVAKRAARLGWTVSKFGGEVWQKWFEAGCPNASDLEAHLAPLEYEGDEDLPKLKKPRK